MKRTLPICFVLAACCAFAQPPTAPPNPLTAGERMVYTVISGYAVHAAEKVPEEDYSFQPSPDVRTFGQLVGHLADANNMFCGLVLGEPRSAVSIEKTKTTKADLVQALQDAVAHCEKAYDTMTDVRGMEIAKFMGRDFPKLTIMSVNTAHTDEHYGNMVTYMRIKGIVPPSSEHGPAAPPPSPTK